jgi:hypothetical protein
LYALSSAGLQVLQIQSWTLVLPQSSDSDGLPFLAKHVVQQEGYAEDDGTGADETGAAHELPEADGYGIALHEDEIAPAHELPEAEGYGTADHEDPLAAAGHDEDSGDTG